MLEKKYKSFLNIIIIIIIFAIIVVGINVFYEYAFVLNHRKHHADSFPIVAA